MRRRQSVAIPDRLPVVYSPRAELDMIKGAALMLGREYDKPRADRWFEGVQEAVLKESEIAPVLTRAQLSVPYVGGPARRFLYRTPGGSPWHIYYNIILDGPEAVQTLYVEAILHAASNDTISES